MHVARKDEDFIPRCEARRALLNLGRDVPLENDGGSYEFKVRYRRDRSTFFVLELASEHTFDDLHRFIQLAWEWECDHLYAFYMNGKIGDERYEIGLASAGATTRADRITLGELGLRLRQKFLYLFDFGDNHEFTILVHRIHTENPEDHQGHLPRIVDLNGYPASQNPTDEFELEPPF